MQKATQIMKQFLCSDHLKGDVLEENISVSVNVLISNEALAG